MAISFKEIIRIKSDQKKQKNYIGFLKYGIFKAFCKNNKLNINLSFLKSELKRIFIFLICILKYLTCLWMIFLYLCIIYDFFSDYSGLYYLVLQFGMVIFSTPHFLMSGITNQQLSQRIRQIFLLKNFLFRLSPSVQTTR